MQSRLNSISAFDKYLFGGLGCGVLMLCVIGSWLAYIMTNLPVPGSPRAVPSTSNSSLTPNAVIPDLSTATTFPTIPFTATVSSQTPSPLPPTFEANPPTGKIVFTCYINQIDQICLMNADGSGRLQLTDFSATAFYPSLSRDGQTIFFSSKQASGFEIYSMKINGDNKKRLTKNIGSLYAPELSPNGERVIFTKDKDGLWLMKPDGKSPRRLTKSDDIDPTWSPDGSKIAFASARNGARQLFVMDSDGSDIRPLTHFDDMGGRSTWSPDGTKLAFYRGPVGNHNIYIITLDGSGIVQLTSGGDNLGPSWSPDGNWITFTSFRDGNNEIYIIHPNGTGLTRLTNNSISDWQPRWGP
jgi:TolB protein